MRPSEIRALAYGLGLLACAFTAGSTIAEPTHLDIRVPDIFRYNLNGPVKRMVTEYSYDMSDRNYKEVVSFDESGSFISRTKQNSRGKIVYFATNTYNQAGCLIQQRVEDVYEKKTNDYEIVLNVPSRKIAYKCRIRGEVEVLSYNEGKYYMTGTIKKRGGKSKIMSAYRRDENNRKTNYNRYEDGRLKYTVAFDWNDNDQLARSMTVYKTEKKKTLNVYEYLAQDDHSNWTQRLLESFDMLDNKKKKFEKFSRRTIEYYEPGEASP